MEAKHNGMSLHIGLNAVNPKGYGGDWSGPLSACENDAADLEAIAKEEGYETQTLLTKEATYSAVREKISRASKSLSQGDIFLITYSGHGGQVPDRNGDEKDGLDETWCLYDRQLVDDELYAEWKTFKAGVRIVVLSDSCHSGTVLKATPDFGSITNSARNPRASGSPFYIPRALPLDQVSRAYRAHKNEYDGVAKVTENEIQASALLISGCQDAQSSMDGPLNGAFTSALLRVWNDGRFRGSYRDFHKQIQRQLPATQQPNLMTLGKGKSFVTEQPFQIDATAD